MTREQQDRAWQNLERMGNCAFRLIFGKSPDKAHGKEKPVLLLFYLFVIGLVLYACAGAAFDRNTVAHAIMAGEIQIQQVGMED